MTTATLPYKIIDARYSGTCRRCQGSIAAGQLIRYYFEDRRTEHALAGECSGPVATVEPPAPATAPSTIMDGYYTVVIEGQGHRTFRIHTNDASADFAPGKQVISFLSGPEEYLKFGFVQGGRVSPWRRFQSGYTTVIEAAQFLVTGDMEQAGRFYAMESGQCYRCNRMLTDPVSVSLGIGPFCRSKV